MTINRDFAENLRAGGDLSGSFDVTGDLATFDNLTVNTAATVPYDNSVSGLTAANIQSAITELNTLVGGGNVGSQATWNVYEFTTVGNDTQFDISTQGSPAPSYVPGYVKVYLNGLLLSESDYTAVDGSTVNFSPAIVDSGQIVSIVVMDSFNTAELLRVTSIDASAGTNSLVLNSSSNFGIGETNPQRKLVVREDSTAGQTNTALYNADTTDGNRTVLSFRGDTTGVGATSFYEFGGISMEMTSHDHPTRAGVLRFATGDSSGVALRMVIDEAGRVGIGTESPVAPLTVSGNNFISWVDSAQGGVRTNEAAGTTASVTGYGLQYKQNVGLGYHSWETSANTTAGNALTYEEHMRIDSSGNVSIGAPVNNDADAQLHVYGLGQTTADLTDSGDMGATLRLSDVNTAAGSGGAIIFTNQQGDVANSAGFAAIKGLLSNGNTNTIGHIAFSTRNSITDTALTERMRIDSSGNLLVGKDANDNSTQGGSIRAGESSFVSGDSRVLTVVRNTNDGDLVQFRQSGTIVGNIGSSSGSLYVADDDTGLFFNRASNNILPYRNDPGNEGVYDAALDLGRATGRFKDLYLSGGVNFSANANATGMTSEVLNDYEEGTWTPNFVGDGTAGSYSGVVRSGTYTKVGNLVTANFYFYGTSGTGSGKLNISGFPFPVTGAAGVGALQYNQGLTLPSGTGVPFVFLGPSTTTAEVRCNSDTSGFFVEMDYPTTANYVRASVTYQTT